MNVGSWQIVATYFGALVVYSNSSELLLLGDFGLGLILLVVNMFLLVITAVWCVRTHRIEEQRKHWKHALSDDQVAILEKIMHPNTGHESASQALKRAGTKIIGSRDPELVLKQYLIDPDEVALNSKLGAGAFGEVCYLPTLMLTVVLPGSPSNPVSINVVGF